VREYLAEPSWRELTAQLESEIDADPRRVFAAASKIIIEAQRAKREDVVARLDDVRVKAFSKMHRRLPSFLENFVATLLLAALGFTLIYVGGAVSGEANYLLGFCLFVLGCLMSLLFSHPAAHLVVASLTHVRVKGLFFAGKSRVEPTLLVDLRSYYHAKPVARFWFHLAGPLATFASTIIIAFVTYSSHYPAPLKILSLALPPVTLFTEAFNSRKHGDIARALSTLKRGVLG